MFSILRKSAQLQELLFKYVCATCQQRSKVSGGVGNNDSAWSPSKSIICSDSRHAGAILLTDDAHSVGICRMLVVVWQFKAYWVCQAEQQQFYSVKQSCRHRGSSAGQVGVNVLKGGIILRVEWSCWGLYESDYSKPAFTSWRSVVQLVNHVVGFLSQDQFILHAFYFEERVLTCCLVNRDKGPWSRVFLLETLVQSLCENSNFAYVRYVEKSAVVNMNMNNMYDSAIFRTFY